MTGEDDKKAERKEATSTQAVKRGHQITMIEIPDDEDDTSFQKWIARGSPTISLKPCRRALPTPPESPMIPTKTPHWDSRCTDIVSQKDHQPARFPTRGQA